MRSFFQICLSLMLFSSAAHAETVMTGEQLSQHIAKAGDLLNQQNFAGVISTVEPVIASFEAAYPASEKLVYCGDDPAQTFMLLIMAASQKKDGIVVDQFYCDAYFMKGFALIDLNRISDAGPFLQKASDLAPLNAHFMNEYAEWYKTNRNWQKSYELFEKAKGIAEYSGESFRKEVEARSLRGMGFNMIEMGKLDDAEKMFKQSLKLLPGHKGSLSELQYIKEQRAKPGK
jgi:tetratricopeptide (TPR) repeat protein